MKRSALTQERLMSRLLYKPDTGEFIRLIGSGKNCAGSATGCMRPDGYISIGVDRLTYLGHRLAWLYMTGEWPRNEVDHIDGNKTNNKWGNLRAANKQQNAANRKISPKNSVGLKGVSFYRPRGMYSASIKVNQKTITLGRFRSPEEAHVAYVFAAKKHFGNFWREQ